MCNLAMSLSHSHLQAVDLVNLALSLFPKTSSLHQLLLLTLNKIRYSQKTRSGKCGDTEAALIRTISQSTYDAVTSRCHSVTPQDDMYMSSEEVRASVLYNSAEADLPNAPSQALDKLLSLILYCKKFKLQEYLVKSHIMLADTQMVLKLYSQALHTLEAVFVLALSSSDKFVQSAARWVYVQAKMANCSQSGRFEMFKRLEKHLQSALNDFLTLVHSKFVCEILYYSARLYDEFGMKDERNKCAKKFRNFRLHSTIHDMS